MELCRFGLERERFCLLGEVGGVICFSLMEFGEFVGRRCRELVEVDILMLEGAFIVGIDVVELFVCSL